MPPRRPSSTARSWCTTLQPTGPARCSERLPLDLVLRGALMRAPQHEAKRSHNHPHPEEGVPRLSQRMCNGRALLEHRLKDAVGRGVTVDEGLDGDDHLLAHGMATLDSGRAHVR